MNGLCWRPAFEVNAKSHGSHTTRPSKEHTISGRVTRRPSPVHRVASTGLAVVGRQEGAVDMSEEPANPEWLVMLYLAGDNTLTEAMVLALQTLKTLKAAGRFARGAIVAQLDPSGVGLPTQTYYFTGVLRSGRLRMIPQLDEFLDPSYSLSETNTGNPNALSGFVEWAHQKYPRAKHHLLILSGHGSGTTEDFLLK